jgi:hypothetical protein
VDLVWNAILATQAQRKESVFEELEELEEEAKPNLSAFGEPLPSASIAGATVVMYNDTSSTLIEDPLGTSLSNSTSAEAVAV